MARKEPKAPLLRAAELEAYGMACFYLRQAAKSAIGVLDSLTAEAWQEAKGNAELTAILEVKRQVAVGELRRAVDGFEDRGE
mgnify:CR=1 FL=1